MLRYIEYIKKYMNNAAEIYKALGNETRLSIVQELARRGVEVAGTQILSGCSGALGLAQPTLSQHFAKLVACDVLTVRKKGTEKFYALNINALECAGIDTAKWKAAD